MAFDSLSGVVVLQGGVGGGYVGLNDTWVYSGGIGLWTNVTTAVHPETYTADFEVMAYDPAADRILLYGGCGNSCYPNQTWSFNPNTYAWTNVNPAGPLPRPSHDSRMVYDARADRSILFGGGDIAPHFYDDGTNTTWAFNWSTNTWTDLKPAVSPPARYGEGLAYDSAADRVILFGGCVQTGYEVCAYANDTWAYDYTNNSWTNLSPATSPSPRIATMVYDSLADRTVLFGGVGNETWTFDFAANRWIDQAPAVSPGPRAMFSMVYDSVHGETVLFGGETSYVPLNDTWTYAYGFITPTIPSSPQALSAESALNEVTLTWQPPASNGGYPVIGYRVYRGTTSGGESFLTHVGNVLTYTDTGLATLTRYYYEVSALNAAGEGPRSNEASGTPPDLTNPTVEILYPTAGATLLTTNVAIRGTASDDVAVQAVEISTDYVRWLAVNGTTVWHVNLTLPVGPVRIWALAVDTSGNRGLATANFTIANTTASGSNGTAGPNSGSGSSAWGIGAAALASIAIAATVAIAYVWRRRWRGGPPS